MTVDSILPQRATGMISLEGCTALVTGGSKGLGFTVAKTYALAGARVAILARGQAALDEAKEDLRRSGASMVRAYACDVSLAEPLTETHRRVEADLGPVDILVNNAGTSRTSQFENISDEVWQADLDLKLFAAIRLSRLVWPGMKARKFGRIINVLNTLAKAPRAGSAPTSVTRAAGLALTKVMAGEGAPHNILVNALLVGLIRSDQWVRKHAAEAPGTDFETFMQSLARDIPLGRAGRPEEFASIALFLASDQASYITGTAINVDGGRSPVP